MPLLIGQLEDRTGNGGEGMIYSKRPQGGIELVAAAVITPATDLPGCPKNDFIDEITF